MREAALSSSERKTVILVILHKSYALPKLPVIYQPIQVGTGSMIDPAFLRDNDGDHIAEKNASFCELTALYWAWKNLDADILGLCHYRRFLGSPRSAVLRAGTNKEDQILDRSQAESLLKDYDLILPKKRHYWIETRESQYAHAHHAEDLQCVEQILSERYPDYMPEWKWMLGTRSGHICNMFVMRRDMADQYCSWLFDILFEAERRLDITSYSDNDRRVFGFLGERLLDVWVRKNGLRYVEVPTINLEKQHWLKKGTAFIQRKIKGSGT